MKFNDPCEPFKNLDQKLQMIGWVPTEEEFTAIRKTYFRILDMAPHQSNIHLTLSRKGKALEGVCTVECIIGHECLTGTYEAKVPITVLDEGLDDLFESIYHELDSWRRNRFHQEEAN